MTDARTLNSYGFLKKAVSMTELDPRSLAKLLRKPEIHRELVGTGSAHYSVGVTKDPSFSGWGLVLRLSEVGKDELRWLSFEGRRIPVLVRYGFEVPKAISVVPAV
jgi:hypothetical protein